MARHDIPALSFEAPVSAHAARQDKIQISVQHGIIMDDADDVGSFLSFLGPQPSVRGIDASVFGRIFTRQRREGPRFADQQIRKRTTAEQPHPPPLFSGLLHIENLRGTESAWRLSSLLSLNPTRFIRHQSFPEPATRLLQPNPRFDYNLYKRIVPPSGGDEFALIESDNWIPDQRLWTLFASPRFWPTHLRNYLTRSVAEIDDDLQRAAEHAQVRIVAESGNPFNLHSVETYWEFSVDDPIGAVRGMRRMFETFAAAAVCEQEYPVTVEQDSPENSLRLSLQTRTGEVMKIYSKSRRRIRIEVTHRLSGGRHGEHPFRLPSGGHTFSTVEGMIPVLNELAEIAAERVNQLLRHFRNHVSVPAGQHTVLKFIADVQAACGTPETAFEILQILVGNGSLVVGHGIPIGDVFREELRSLVRHGVLQTSNRRYSVTPAYRQALRNLELSGVGFVWGTRIRRKRDSQAL